VVSRADGRMEKRIRLAVPVELSGMHDPATVESTRTENICALGVRVITKRSRKPNEHVRLMSPVGRLKVKARVVYCQVVDGGFAIGLQFEKLANNFALAARGISGTD
jgi:hypothetical protein